MAYVSASLSVSLNGSLNASLSGSLNASESLRKRECEPASFMNFKYETCDMARIDTIGMAKRRDLTKKIRIVDYTITDRSVGF